MQTSTNLEKLKPWMGFILFAVGLLFLMFPGAYMQSHMGIPGLILTELCFLAISILYCLIMKVSLREVFPIKKISFKDFFGVFFLFIGGFMLNFICLGVSMKVLDLIGKRAWISEAGDLSDFLFGSGLSKTLILVIVAVTPAICEESFMRGAVLSNFRSLKKDWLIILIIGVMFGILHLSPLRFLNTACLGALLAYIMVKKNNILLPMLLHLFNNMLSSFGGMFSSPEALETSQSILSEINTTQALGSYLIVGFLSPIFLVLGAMLLDKESHRASHFAVAGVISGLLLIAGFAIMALSMRSVFAQML